MTTSAQATRIVMPKLGLTMTEATLLEWHKQPGDTVSKGELLFTFESDKAALELESPASGVLTILVPTSETVPVGTPVALLTPPGVAPEDAQFATFDAAADAFVEKPESVPSRSSTVRANGGPVAASPKARREAHQRGLSLAGLQGSGPRGMIVTRDLELASSATVKASPLARRVAAETSVDLSAVTATGPGGRISRADVLNELARGYRQAGKTLAPQADPLDGVTGLRGIIARRLTQGWNERPQVTLTTDADAANLVAARKAASETLGEKVSYDALLVVLAARALREFPYVNATLTENGIEQVEAVNVGVAVDTERGLLVPVVHHADTLSLSALNAALRDLASRASEGASLPDDLTGGTFTITNLGMFDIDTFTPIINPPEAAILGVGRIVERPVGRDGQVVLRPMMALSLSFDHRLVDGAPAARFLARIRQLVENPFLLTIL